MNSFSHYIGVDYSGAMTPTDSLRGLRIFTATGNREPEEKHRPYGPKHYWTRRGLAEWLGNELGTQKPTIVGIDHGFSFPKEYFDKYRIPLQWDSFLDDFCAHWPSDEDHVCVDFIRDGICGNGSAREGNARWRRLTEKRTGSAKSVFHFDVPGSVAKSTHAGIPWLRFLRKKLGQAVHFWPFDGWMPPAGKHVIAEVYPRLWSNGYPSHYALPDQNDAYAVCKWLQDAGASGTLSKYLNPQLAPDELMIASYEGWILGLL